MLQGLTRCATSTPYTLPSSILVFSPVHRIRLLNRSPSSSPELFSIIVSVTVLHPRLPPSFSILVFSSVHRSRLRHRPPSSFSALFTGFVTGTVLRPVSVTVLHPRFQLCSLDLPPIPVLRPRLSYRPPSPSPLPSSILVFSRPVFWGCY